MRKLVLLGVLLATPVWSYAQGCAYSRDYDFSIDAAGLERLLLDVGAGDLRIAGEAGGTEVRVVARACASSSRRLDELELDHRLQGSDLLVHTELHKRRGFFSWLNFGNSRIDIHVTMPRDLYLRVDDGSGEIDIRGVSELAVDDGSGSIFIADIAGDVFIDDGSGAISVEGASGTVSVDDGSGPIRIRDSAAVRIIDDGSGDILIENIRGDLTIENDGSGSISVSGVGGDLSLGDTGSGSVNVNGVAGTYSSTDH